MSKLLTKGKILKFLKKILPFIGIFLLLYIIYDIGLDDIFSTLNKLISSPIYIVIAAVLTLPRLLIRNVQWQYIQKKQKIFVDYIKSLKIFLIGYFYGAVTPGYSGALLRVAYLKDETDEPVGKLFVNVFALSAINTLPLYFFASIGAFLIVSQRLPENFFIDPDLIPIIAFIFLIFQLLFLFFFVKEERGMKVFKFLVRLVFIKKIRSLIKRFVETFYKNFPRIRDFIVPFLLAIPCWLIMYAQIYILGLPLGITKIPFFDFFLLYAIANIIAFIPITSGGLGLREITLLTLFNTYGVEASVAVVIGIAGHLVTDVLTGIYGLIIAFFEARNNKTTKPDVKA